MDNGGEQPAEGQVPATTSIGRMLRLAREARGESLADAAYALKLTQSQVDAMERERFDLLPGPAFVRGFLRNYARHLGVEHRTPDGRWWRAVNGLCCDGRTQPPDECDRNFAVR